MEHTLKTRSLSLLIYSLLYLQQSLIYDIIGQKFLTYYFIWNKTVPEGDNEGICEKRFCE